MEYTISIRTLINRPVIRNDKPLDFMNKMTDEEINEYSNEVEHNLLEEGVAQEYQTWNGAFLAKTIDRDIIYTLLHEKYSV